MVTRNFATIGVPKRDADGHVIPGSFTFAVYDGESRLGNFTLALPQINYVAVSVKAEEYQGNKYFRFMRGFSTESEVKSYLDTLTTLALPETVKLMTDAGL